MAAKNIIKNQTLILPSPPYNKFPEKIYVQENKAPTDESIKYYEELREKAIKSIANSYTIENSEIKGVVIEFERICYHQQFQILIAAKINGEEIRKIINVDNHLPMSQGTHKEQIVAKTKEVLQKFILDSIIKELNLKIL